MLSIGSFIQHELQRNGCSTAAFQVVVDEVSSAGEGTVRVTCGESSQLGIRFWRTPDDRVVVSVAMTPGSHSVRALPMSEVADCLAQVVQRWVGALGPATR